MIHETARVEQGVALGRNVQVWDHSIIRSGATVDDNTIIGANVYIDGECRIGRNCKIQNGANLYGAILEDGVFIGPGVVVTNDKHPRAVTPDRKLKTPDDWTSQRTLIREGASIGANATIICGVEIGEWAAVGAGAVVVHNVPLLTIVAGVPASKIGIVDRAFKKLWSYKRDTP
jgi:UDP-2-acetamido-3-amino-2,3-dideoxy-glucuronate N-acetyltransferase